MRKIILAFILSALNAQIISAQNWLRFPENNHSNWISLGDLDIPGNKITVEALVSLRDTVSGHPQNIVSKHTGPGDVNYLLRPQYPFGFEISTSSGYKIVRNPKKLCKDSVYHLAGTYDGDSLRFYVNGVKVAVEKFSGTLTQNERITAIGNMSATPIEPFGGYVDEVRIWNVARTQAEIFENMYNLSNPASQTGLLAYYTFESNFLNSQGNSALNGTVMGLPGNLAILANPSFNGQVSTRSCLVPTSNIKPELGENITAFPNPTSGSIYIQGPGSEVEVLNNLGQSMFIRKMDDSNRGIDLAKNQNGLYLLIVRKNTEIISKIKVLKIN